MKKHKMLENQNFGKAIKALKKGKKVLRCGWNGKGMYLILIQGYPVNGHLNPDSIGDCHTPSSGLPSHIPDGKQNKTQGYPGQMLSHIVMKTEGDSHYWGLGYSDYVPWDASHVDILAEDWCILD